MDFTAATLNSLASNRDSASTKMYPSFTAPTPLNLSRNPYGSLNTLPSPLHLDFPSITPPRSPYDFYGMYSPASSSDMRSLYDPSYLKRLKSNPMFRDLQSLLLQECLQMQVPASLITTSWNLMHVPKTTGTALPEAKNIMGSGQEVYMQHMKLQDKLLKVRIDPAISADGLSVENEYSTEVGHIEMGRYRALHSCPDEKVKVTINSYYDKERLQLVKNTESKLDTLIEKADCIRKAVEKSNQDASSALTRQGAQPAQGASLLLQPVDETKMSAVRQLKFNTSGEKEADDDDDYLNCSVNSEDFEIDEIDVETVDTKDTVEKENVRSESAEPVVSLSPINYEPVEKDLLQQCIAESGISATPDKLKNSQPGNSDYLKLSTVSDNWTILPDSSTTESPESVKLEDTDSDSNSDHKFSSTLHTPQPSHGLKFTQPKNINVALTEIQKLCSGPAVSFTPELRRDITISYTPDSQKCSPLSEIGANTSGNLNNSYQNSVPQNKWINTPSEYDKVTVDELKHGYNKQNTKKRKSCDDIVIDIPDDINTVSEQVNLVTESCENTSDYQTPVLKTHRMLTSSATDILTNWYNAHVQYPYPSDEEVEHLANLTNITTRQVKKWMANKRVRCFNTLSITGNQHPIKYKYNGAGRRKRVKKEENVMSGKENCDSTSGNKPPYSLLNEEPRRILNEWFEAHVDNPYPTEEEKQQLAFQCGISVSQVKSWFANKRNRTNNTRKQVPNYFLSKFPEYTHVVNFVGQKREEARASKRRKINEIMYIQPTFYI